MTENIFAAPSAAPRLRQLPENENFKRRDEVVGTDRIRCTFAIRQDRDAPRFEKAITFDFDGVSREQLMLLSATNGIVVWAQRVLREMGDGMINPSALSTVRVLDDIIEGPDRVPVEPKVRARRAFDRLSPEERDALIDELTAA